MKTKKLVVMGSNKINDDDLLLTVNELYGRYGTGSGVRTFEHGNHRMVIKLDSRRSKYLVSVVNETGLLAVDRQCCAFETVGSILENVNHKEPLTLYTASSGTSVKATWDISLYTQCPKCEHDFDAILNDDFWEINKKLECCEWGTERSANVLVYCPECGHNFKVECIY